MAWRVHINRYPTLERWYTRVDRRPGWVVQLALLAAVFVVVVPLLMLVAAAVFVGLLVFVALSAIVRIMAVVSDGWRRITGHRNASGGRQNVRVVRR